MFRTKNFSATLILILCCWFCCVQTPRVSAQNYLPGFHQDTLNGNWRGGWVSDVNGHRGSLNATFCRINDQQVQADFRGTFARVLPFRYRPVLNVVHQEPGLMVLQGSRRLPLMGNFDYQATIVGNSFEATYRSRRDHGRWSMSR